MEFFTKINWIDIFIFIVIVRSIYIGINHGFVIEIFKLLGLASAIFCSLHFYVKLALFLKEYTPLSNHALEIFSFISLIVVGNFIFIIIRKIFLLIFKQEVTNIFSKFLGCGIAFLRGILLSGLVINLFILVNTEYLVKSVNKSYSGISTSNTSNKVYDFINKLLIKKEGV